MEAAEDCKISFNIDYTSSLSVDYAFAYYKKQGPGQQDVKQELNPVPASGELVKLPIIQDPGTYDLRIELLSGNVSAESKSFFKIGMCASCEKPSINKVAAENDGQLVMSYILDNYSNFVAVEYQIATDAEFTDIIYSQRGVNYYSPEYIDMNRAKILKGIYYMRVRKYCSAGSETGVSDWSDVSVFEAGEWTIQKTVQAFCIPDNYGRDNEIICKREDDWKRYVMLNTPEPKIGSLIYLKDGITLAVPGNLEEFDMDPFIGFNKNGIRWIRFPDFDMSVVYEVNSNTARIEGISGLTC